MSREDRSTFGLTEPARQEQVQPEVSKSHSFLSISFSFFLFDPILKQNFPSERIWKKTPLLCQFQICFRLISCLLVPYLELVRPYYACLRPMKVFFFKKKGTIWHLLLKNSNLQYRIVILKILIFETFRDPWVQLQRRHHYFITFCTTTKEGKHKQTKIIWQNLLKWNSIFFSRSDLSTDDHLLNWKRWTSSSSSALLGQHLSPFLVRVDDAIYD